MTTTSDKPVLFSCSGCSNVAQAANSVAVSLNLEGKVEMSCTAGLAVGVKAHVRKATSGRPVIAVDGCEIACVRASLDKLSVSPHAHVVATDLGIRKRTGELCPDEDIRTLRDDVEKVLPG
ncbi:MAG: zinc-binding protein [Gammaproteobacteria bacterium]|nr:MAG: zinc-binding protein [Gammaproteobacteria bacterium]